MMGVVTKERIIKGVPEKWNHFYRHHSGERMLPNGRSISSVYNALKKLEEEDKLTESSILNIIGNASWTSLVCDSCGRQVDKVVSFPSKFGSFSTHFNACPLCILQAHEAATKNDHS